MTENLHTKLVDTLKAHSINPALSEDEIDSYPYVTFELPVEYRYTKDGQYKIVGNLTIRSVSDDFDEADTLRSGIESAIAHGFGGPSSSAPVEDVEEEEEVSEVMPEDPPEETDPTEEPADPGVDPGENQEPADEEEPEDPEDPDTPIPDDPEDPEPGQQEIPPETEDPVVEGVCSARLTDVRKDCMDGIWVIELDYILTQYE